MVNSSKLKAKTYWFRKSIGRNHKGKITAWHRGGGHKKLFRNIDLKRISSEGIVVNLQSDPNRSALLAQIFNPDKKSNSYILAPHGLNKGDVIRSNSYQKANGYSQRLQYVITGTFIHNLSLKPSEKGKLLRSAGSYGKLIKKTKHFAKIRLKSGQIKWFDINTYASLGIVSNINARFTKFKKAGERRWLGWRPTVRGVAMNPIDHPHGGGEGKTSGGRPSVTPWGKPTRGFSTKKK